MINPRQCAERVCTRQNASDLYDLIIYARNAKGPESEALLDDAEEFIYSQTEHSEQSKVRFRQERLGSSVKVQASHMTT